jgi:hypothetical protein
VLAEGFAVFCQKRPSVIGARLRSTQFLGLVERVGIGESEQPFVGDVAFFVHDRCRVSHRRRCISGVPLTGPCSAPASSAGPDWPPGSVIYTGPDEPNLRVVRILDTENDDPEMHLHGARRRRGLGKNSRREGA